MVGRDKQLFSEYDLRSVILSQQDKLTKEIDALETIRILNTNPDELIEYFEKKYTIDIPILNEPAIQVDQEIVQVDVSRDQNRFISDRSRSFYIEGTKITYFVPFVGDRAMFNCRPSTYTFNPPYAQVENSEILFIYESTDHKADDIKKRFEHDLQEVKRWLNFISADLKGYNQGLRGLAGNRITTRREKLIKDQGLVASLGFPMRHREGAAKTYVVPTVKRKMTPMMPPQGTSPYFSEPTIEMKEYEYILSIITNMVSVMERSPKSFKTMGEEDLRQHFLVQLNGVYEGQATGETFNFEGKTDILIREKGKNIFIAECKFWRGPEQLKETIDQLLNYATWRDSKLAILVFNRDILFSTVLVKIPEVVKMHPAFIKQVDYSPETGFRFILRHKDDPQRELTLTIVAFEIPK